MSTEPEDLRTEYTAIVQYHTALCVARFTVGAFFLAGTGLLAQMATGGSGTALRRDVAGLLGCFLSGVTWIIEARIRAVYENIALRGQIIERTHWQLNGAQCYQGFFSRQYKTRPEKIPCVPAGEVPAWPGFDKVTFLGRPLPSAVLEYVSISRAFDLLYAGSALVWLILLGADLVRWL